MATQESYVAVSDIDKRIGEIREVMRRLPIELEMLEELRRSATPVRPGGPDGGQMERRLPRRLGPKEAILRLIAQAPGLRPKEIVNRLEGQVQSESENVRRTIASTLYNLRRAGILKRDAEGGFSPGDLQAGAMKGGDAS